MAITPCTGRSSREKPGARGDYHSGGRGADKSFLVAARPRGSPSRCVARRARSNRCLRAIGFVQRRHETRAPPSTGSHSLLLGSTIAPSQDPAERARAEADAFLDFYSRTWVELYTVAQEADWVAATDVSDAHTAASVASQRSLATFTGNALVIEKAKNLLAKKTLLTDLQVRQLDKILLAAAENPGTIPDVVKARLEAEGKQRNTLDGFAFQLDDGKGGKKAVTPNDLDDILHDSKDLAARRRAWESAKSVGPALKAGLVDLRGLRNRVATEMGYPSFFSLQVADFGMSTQEMMETLDRILEDIRPLYVELHCWAKNQLAKRYGQPVPKKIPAHWLTNRWAQEWPGLVDGIDLDPLFAKKEPKELIGMAETFYRSLGFAALPKSFWEKSDLYALAADAPRKKNTHASAWHIDQRSDVRSLMSVKPDWEWFTTTHHELGHIYYYISYSTPRCRSSCARGEPRLPRGDRRADLARGEPAALPAGDRRPRGGKEDRLGSLAFERRAPLGRILTFRPERCRTSSTTSTRRTSRRSASTRPGGNTLPSIRGGAAGAARRGVLRCGHQDPHQRRPRPILRLRARDRPQVPAPRPHLQEDPEEGRPRCQLSRKQRNGGLPPLDPGAGREQGLARGVEGGDGEDLSGRAMLEYYAPLLEWLKKENAGKDKSW